MNCHACDHEGRTQTGNWPGPAMRHSQVFTDSESGLSFCIDHTSQYISWLLDGGIVDEPEMWAWVLVDSATSGANPDHAQRDIGPESTS